MINQQNNTATAETLMSFRDVTLGYGRRDILTNINIDLNSGGYIGIVGPNGSGKTTLLHSILGMLPPIQGTLTVHRKPLTFGYVPQAQTMDDHFPLSALDIVLMGRYPKIALFGRPSAQDRKKAMEALEQVGIPDLANRLFREFSGGQKQRTLMARALVSDPDVLVLDEPTNDMDVAAEHATMELVDKLHEEKKLLVLMVSHMLNVVANHVHQVAIIGNGKMELGLVNDVVNKETLARLYNMPLDVAEFNGRRVVL